MSKSRIALTLNLVLVLLGVTWVITTAQADGYSIAWWTVDNGGGESSSGSYSLAGTIGQPDASTTLQGGSYIVTGGYWGAAGGYQILLPMLQRGG